MKARILVITVLAALAAALLASTASAQDPVNEAPNASFRVNPRSPSVDQRARFNASASKDADGTIVQYAWDYGDGTTKVETDPISRHTYRQPGTYTATLVVTDDRGCTFGDPYTDCTRSNRARATKTVVVADRAVKGGKLKARARQPQSGRRIRIDVQAGAAEPVQAIASGFVKVRGRRAKLALVPSEADVAAKARATLPLRLRNQGARRRVAKALRDETRVQATIFVQLIDEAGNEVRLMRTVLLI